MIVPERLQQEFISLAAISAPSFAEREMADRLRPRLEALGFTVQEDDCLAEMGGNCGNLYGFRPGELDAPPLLFSAHMDTVKPCEKKTILVDADGTIHSDGTTILGADDLSGVVEFLQAVEGLIAEHVPLRPLEVLFTVSEEFFLKGASGFDYRKLKSREVYVLDVDGEIGTAVCAAPTGIRIIANITGRAAHAALAPEEGCNAILIAAAAIARMKLGRLDAQTTANIGIIRGGLSGNIVPEQCFVEGETRSLDGAKAEAQCAAMQAAFLEAAAEFGGRVDFEITRVYDAYRVAPESAVVQRFVKACQQAGLSPKLTTSTGGSDNSVFSQHGLTGIVLASGMHRIHSVEEYTTLAELCTMTQVVQNLIQLP